MRAEVAFRAIADPTRRRILDLLRGGEQNVVQLCQSFEVSQPAISQHLGVLRSAGLVVVRSEGRRRYYALNAGPLQQVYDWAGQYKCFWDARLEALGAVLDEVAIEPSERH